MRITLSVVAVWATNCRLKTFILSVVRIPLSLSVVNIYSVSCTLLSQYSVSCTHYSISCKIYSVSCSQNSVGCKYLLCWLQIFTLSNVNIYSDSCTPYSDGCVHNSVRYVHYFVSCTHYSVGCNSVGYKHLRGRL